MLFLCRCSSVLPHSERTVTTPTKIRHLLRPRRLAFSFPYSQLRLRVFVTSYGTDSHLVSQGCWSGRTAQRCFSDQCIPPPPPSAPSPPSTPPVSPLAQSCLAKANKSSETAGHLCESALNGASGWLEPEVLREMYQTDVQMSESGETVIAAEEDESPEANENEEGFDGAVPQATAARIRAMTSSARLLHAAAIETSATANTDETGITNDFSRHTAASPGSRSGTAYLTEQDTLYLSYPAQVVLPPPPPSFSAAGNREATRECVLVVFHQNDLRTRDHYALALAARRALGRRSGARRTGEERADELSDEKGGEEHHPRDGSLPLVAAVVLDYRLFAQPSVVGGFYRQSPMRAQFLLDAVASLRHTLESVYGIPLLVRCGRPEEHVPRLSVELGALEVFMTTQYAPHEQEVQRRIQTALEKGVWHSRHTTECGEGALAGEKEDVLVEVHQHPRETHPYYIGPGEAAAALQARRLGSSNSASSSSLVKKTRVHLVWQSTLVHLHDLPKPLHAMRESERWYHDEVTVANIRPTSPYTAAVEQLRGNESRRVWVALLPSVAERRGLEPPPPCRGRLPTLEELGYYYYDDAEMGVAGGGRPRRRGRGDRQWFTVEEVIGTQSALGQFPLSISPQDTASPLSSGSRSSSFLGSGVMEEMAGERLQEWLRRGGVSALLRFGRERRTNTKLYSQHLARLSPYIALGVLSPRQVYEALRQHAAEKGQDGFVQQQCREGILRLSRRDFCHWCGLRYGKRLFYSYGPRPEDTEHVGVDSEEQHRTGEDLWKGKQRRGWKPPRGSGGRVDEKIIHKWCRGLTGFPLADAAARELLTTGFVAKEGREALVWLLSRGLGQDWRVAAEWLERCSLDYDPFICYYQALRCSDLLPDDMGETVRSLHYLAHHHDQTGIYVKKWLPVLSKVPPVYIHRPHIMTERMQAMHQVYLGRNYPFPIKLWDGAVEDLKLFHSGSNALGTYFAEGEGRPAPHHVDEEQREDAVVVGLGFGEALRHGTGVLLPEEWSRVVTTAYLRHRSWLREVQSWTHPSLQDEEVMAALGSGTDSTDREETAVVLRDGRHGHSPSHASLPAPQQEVCNFRFNER